MQFVVIILRRDNRNEKISRHAKEQINYLKFEYI